MRVQREDVEGAIRAAYARGEIGVEILYHPGSEDLALEVLGDTVRFTVESLHRVDIDVGVRPSRDIPRGAFALKCENRGFIGYV